VYDGLVNVVVLAGTVVADPVQRRMPSGDEVAHIRVASAYDDDMCRSVPVVALMVALAVAVTSCTAEASSGIGGSLTYYGGPAPGVHGREPGEVVAYDEDGEEVARQSVQEGDGFGFTLRPGTYKLVGTSGDATCKDLRVTLAAGQFVDLEIACQVR
jgi:hypothetical protein